MRKIKIIIACIITIFCLNFIQKAYAYNNYGNLGKSFATRKYILGPNDIISIKFLNIPELDQENIRIQPDGNINIAPIGTFRVMGLTIEELQNQLGENYRYYLKDPQISVKLVESRPFIVYVTGAVTNPGGYELDTSTTTNELVSNIKPEIKIERKTPLLSNILVAAGGVKYEADLEHIQIHNKIDNSRFEINLLDLLENGNSEQDIYLMAGDTVHVPKLPTPLAITPEKYRKYANATFSPQFVSVRVIGYVNKPGLVTLKPGSLFTVNSAISAAGGYFNDAAYAPKKIYISRPDGNGKLVTKAINPMQNDEPLMPRDIIYVPEKTRPLIGKAFDYLGRIINPAGTFANSYNTWALMFNPYRHIKY